jgi:hypothetical protein
MPSEKEGRLLLALQAFENHQMPSLRAAAKAYDVSFETLRRRHHGTPSRAGTPANSLLLTLNEEQLLLQKILYLAAQGNHPQQAVVRDMANIILQTKNPANPKTVGKNWVTKFVKRHPEIQSCYNRKYDYQRARCEDPELIGAWFKLVQQTIQEYGIPDEDIYNFDETGFQMGVISTSKVITSSDRNGRPRTTQPGNREWVTVVEAVNAKGWALPPFIIFAAKLHQMVWYQAGLPSTWKLAVSDNGWTNDELGLQWIQHFNEYTRNVYKSKWRLLIFDGHGSHQTTQFAQFCLENHILTLCMPAHSSHILQPLDVSCFSPLKRVYGQQIEQKMRLGSNHITKQEFLPAFFTAHQQVMTPSTIAAGFRATGLVPFDPSQVLANLETTGQHTPPLNSSQSSWEAQTPHTLPHLQKQAQLVLEEGRKRRRSSVSSGERPFLQLLKGFETAVHERAILQAEVATLKAENQYQKRQRTYKKGTIQKGGSLSIQDGEASVQAQNMIDPVPVEIENRQTEFPTSSTRTTTSRAPSRCSKCGSHDHTFRLCRI